MNTSAVEPLAYTRRDAALRVVAVMVPAAALLVLHALSVPLCPMKLTTGVPCPGCGLTRAAVALLHGDVAGALHFHPFVFIIVPGLVWFVGRDVLAAAGLLAPTSPDPLLNLPKWVPVVFLVAFVGLWALRLATGTHPDGFHLEHGVLLRVLH